MPKQAPHPCPRCNGCHTEPWHIKGLRCCFKCFLLYDPKHDLRRDDHAIPLAKRMD